MGRPLIYTTETVVCLRATGEAKLQKESDRRAIVNLLVDNGGCMTIGEINAHFGFDISDRVKSLVHGGWLTI